jgi:hypothetical protein
LPTIAYLLPNGTIIDRPGDFKTNMLSKRQNTTPNKVSSIVIPKFGKVDFNQEFMARVGKAAGNSTSCPIVNQQKCINDLFGFNGFLTCSSQKKWTVLQFCDNNTRCKNILKQRIESFVLLNCIFVIYRLIFKWYRCK